MSKDIKKLNNSIASFMLLSLALSSSTLAGINENSIASTETGNSSVNNSSPVMDMYGIPIKNTDK